MTERQFAATPWEVEAERRRETIAADAAAGDRRDRSDDGSDILTRARGRRLLASLGRSFDDRPPRAGRTASKGV